MTDGSTKNWKVRGAFSFFSADWSLKRTKARIQVESQKPINKPFVIRPFGIQPFNPNPLKILQNYKKNYYLIKINKTKQKNKYTLIREQKDFAT